MAGTLDRAMPAVQDKDGTRMREVMDALGMAVGCLTDMA
jgi:hypothetical protein